jgi:multidrug resistance efflux pump
VTLDSGVERAATEAARYRSTMQGRIRTGESRVEFSTAKYNRREKLAGQSFISLHDRDEALTEKRLAESELIEAKDDRRLAEIEFAACPSNCACARSRARSTASSSTACSAPANWPTTATCASRSCGWPTSARCSSRC